MTYVRFDSFPDISESVKTHQPYYWENLQLNHNYKVVSDYEKLIDGKSVHFLLIVNQDRRLQEIPVRDNILVNFTD